MHYPSTYGRRDPFALMRRMMADLDTGFGVRPGSVQFPAVNVWQNAEAVAVTAELPGVEADEIDITVKENVLTLSGERKAPEVAEGSRWHRRERGYGKFSRAIRLPFEADAAKVEARFTNGILHVVIGRPDEEKPRRIEIKAA
ncbi:MAG: Hsp20/alpha crystallin family protein [Rhodobacteraceae bacterium]|nr:Hsp20/alpha crystallin family protein [Paracoccaceae bacterium]